MMFKAHALKLAIAGICTGGLVACGEGANDLLSDGNSIVVTVEAQDGEPTGEEEVETPVAPDSAAVAEAQSLMDALAAMGGSPFDAATATDFPDAYNVFMPSVTGVDLNLLSDSNPSGPTGRLPMFEGRDPDGNPVDFIITEASDLAVAEMMGIVYAPRLADVADSAGAQLVTIENGIIEFPGTVDFSPTRSVTPGDPNATEGPNSITRSEFPPAAVQPGAVGDDEWSSLVVLPSGLVVNAQLMANATGIHDRIPDSGQDDQNNPNLDRVNRFVVLQLLDGWQDDERYYFHIVTDASVPDAASIELGVFAPRVGLIPTAGVFPEDGRLPFSPNVNGVFDGPEGSQGLNVSATDQTIDPVNVFPIDPIDPRFSPMWDVHLSMWTSEAIDNDLRRVITSVDDLAGLIDEGLIVNFVGNDGPENDFIAGLMPANAIINCPVLLQPQESVIGTTFGVFEN